MELRHLRYFVAVAEAGSLKLAAQEKLHTTQPSLSRQIRDLEHEVGTPLFSRSARGVELTAAGRVFLDHARLVLSQAETALRSVRQLTKPSFALGFMIGHDSTWIPQAVDVLHDQLPQIHVVISTQNSPQLAAALSQGLIDVAFLRQEDGGPGLEYLLLSEEPLEIYLPKDHPLAKRTAISLQEIAGETFLSADAPNRGTAGNGNQRSPVATTQGLGYKRSYLIYAELVKAVHC